MRRLTAILKNLLLSVLVLGSAGAALAQEGGGSPTLKRVAESGNVYLAYRESSVPFSYLLPGEGGPAGYAWDVCLGVVKALEEKLGRPLNVVPVAATANGRLMMVRAGMADMECGATTNTLGRQKLVSFSNTIFVAQVRGMVRRGGAIRSLGDLEGKRVVTASGTSADRLVKMAALQRNLSVRLLEARDHFEAMSMLQQGEADMYVADDAILAAQRAAAGAGADFELLSESFALEPYGLVLPLEDREFKTLVDGALVAMMQSGRVQQIYDKWFVEPIPPAGVALDLPMTELLRGMLANPNDRPVN